MALRLKFKGGQIEAAEADSPEELFAYHQLFRNGFRTKASAELEEASSDAGQEPLPESARKLVRILASAPAGLNSGDVAKALGVPPQGLGGFVTSLTNWGKKRGLSRRQLVAKQRVPNGEGHLLRRIRLTDAFLKLIKEGKVAGL